MGPGVGPTRVSHVDTFETSVGLCTRGVGSLSDDAALPGIHGDILYASGDPLSSQLASTSLADAGRDGSAVLAATDADDIVVAPTGDPNEPIASATANDIVTAPSLVNAPEIVELASDSVAPPATRSHRPAGPWRPNGPAGRPAR